MWRTIGLFTSYQHHIDIPLQNVSAWEKTITTDYRHLLFILTRRSWTFFFFFNLNLYIYIFFFYVSIICTSSVALQYLTRHKKLNPITCQLPWFLPASALQRCHLHHISSDQVISFPPIPLYKPHVYFCHVCNAPLTSYQLRPPQALSGTDPIQMDISLEGEQANPSWRSNTQGHTLLFRALG